MLERVGEGRGAHNEVLPVQLLQAWNTGYPQLYHYQPFNPDWLSQTISAKQLYFSNPATFNDPWDCRPHYNSAAVTDPLERERHVEEYIRITRKHGPDIRESEVQRRAEVFRSNPAFLKAQVDKTSAGISEGIAERYRVYCLSTKPDSELMWAHYATQHKGICLEFTARSELLCSAFKVSYLRQYPLYDFAEGDMFKGLMVMLTKSSAWEYENEYRLIAEEWPPAALNGDALVANDNLVQLPDGSLRAIILGCLAPESTIQAVKALIQHSTYPISLKRAVKALNQYKLVITPS